MVRVPARIFDLSQSVGNAGVVENAHGGTRCIAPCILFDDGLTIDRLPLATFVAIGLPLDLRGVLSGPEITRAHLDRFHDRILEGETVLLNTGRTDAHLTREAAHLLVERGVSGVGIDTLSPGFIHDYVGVDPAHYALLRSDRFIVEALCFPDAVMDGKKRLFVALPMKLCGKGAAWARATLWEFY